MILLRDTIADQVSLIIITASYTCDLAVFENENDLSVTNESIKYLLNNNLKYSISHNLVKNMTDNFGIINSEDPQGTVAFFHPNLFDTSNSNISQFERDGVIVAYSDVHDLVQSERPKYLYELNADELVASNVKP